MTRPTQAPALATFENLSLETLRARRSAKWQTHPADVLPAWVAEMDFPLAEPIRATLLEALEHDDCGYPSPGPLMESFAAFASDRYEWDVDPARVRVVPDVMSGVTGLLRALAIAGAGVVVNTPIYPPFFVAIREAGLRVVEAPLSAPDGRWELDLDVLEHAFSDGVAVYLLCNPHNPTGRVFTREELEAVAGLASRYGVVVLADEIHAPLALVGATHTPYVSLGEEAAAHGLTLTSASKAWNIAGLKCAVVVSGSDAGASLAAKLPPHLAYHVGHFGVLASIAAFTNGRSWLDALLTQLDANRRRLAALLAEALPEIRYSPPEAGYLAWLDCRELDLGKDPAASFLEQGRVALMSGPTFGTGGDGFVRLNFGTSSGLLEEAVRRMAATLASASTA